MTVLNLIEILRKQSDVYSSILEEELSKAQVESDVYTSHSTIFKEFYTHAFRPLTESEKIKDISLDKMKDIMTFIESDLSTTYFQSNNISKRIGESYNSNQDYKTRIRNRVEYLSSIVSDINIMLNEDSSKSIVFKDSLSNYNFIDLNYGSGIIANISTSEGIAHLSISEDKNLIEGVKEVKISGNGKAGNYQVIKKVNVKTFDENYDIYAKYKSEEESHDKESFIVDNQPSTWFEYQKLGLREEDASSYNIRWANAYRTNDELTLRVVIELDTQQSINWIDISPYIPEKSKSDITLYSVKLSLDGSNYKPIYRDRDIINRDISIIPQRYSKDDLFKQDNLSKFVSQGVLNFPTQVAKYIEIILKQTKPYDEVLGTIYYTRATLINGKEVNHQRIDEQSVPPNVIAGPQGKYKIGTDTLIIKDIAVFNGWRYLIGLRGIDIYDRKFNSTSEIITNKFEAPGSIKKIILYANEIIPDEFLSTGLEKRNSWIRYFVSINDNDWYPISPMHHNQVGSLSIPPKIYEINSLSSDEERISAINKGYLTSKEEVTSVRLKILFSRPDSYNTFSPILEEYALKCIIEGGS